MSRCGGTGIARRKAAEPSASFRARPAWRMYQTGVRRRLAAARKPEG